jgi:hypothetical protein
MSAITTEWVAPAPEATATKSEGVFRTTGNWIGRQIAIRRNRPCRQRQGPVPLLSATGRLTRPVFRTGKRARDRR